MSNHSPIPSPPPELVRQWEEQFLKRPTINGCFIQSYIATRAALAQAEPVVDDDFVTAVNDLAKRTHKSKAEVLRDAINLYYKAVNEWEKNGRGIVFQEIAQPEPAVAPTVMEIIELHSWLDDEWHANNDGEDLPALDFARAVLARWGTPAIQPVPVSERLPGPEDCDADDGCWWWHPDHKKDDFDDGWILLNPKWAGGRRDSDDSLIYTHWLPHWALPVPTPANTINQED